MQLICTVTPNFDENIYLYFDENTKDGILIDPGFYQPELLEKIEEEGVNIKGILLTHGHYDHIYGVQELKEKFGCKVYSGEEEVKVTDNPAVSFTDKIDGRKFVADVLLKDEEEIVIGSLKLKTIFTPGHTPGGVCFVDESTGCIFTGDTLFKGTHGRTDFPLGDFNQLKASIFKLFELPDEFQVFPGHYGSSTIGAEKVSNGILM